MKNACRKSSAQTAVLRFIPALASLAAWLGCCGSAAAENIMLAWDRHSSHTNLSAYVIKYGGSSGGYTGTVAIATNFTTATVSNLAAGRIYYFAVSALDTLGVESDPSNEVFTNTPARPNLPPLAGGSGVQTAEDQPVSVLLGASDPDGDSLTYTILSSPAHGTLSGTAPNLVYLPTLNFFGTDSFTFRVSDGMTNSAVATIDITVNAVNDVPTLAALANLTVAEDAVQQTVSLTGISSGINESQTLTLTATSSNPALIPNPSVNYANPNATGSLVFTPMANANGSATITVTINDGQSQNPSVTRTFVVTVTSVNDAPTLDPIGNITINEDASQQIVSLGGILAGGNESQSLTVTANSSNPSLIPHPTVGYISPNSTGSLGFRPVANASGTASITVTVSDGQSQNGIVSRTFTVQLNPVNDLPTISNISDQTLSENGGTLTLAFTVGDVETAGGSLTVSANSSDLNLVPNSNLVLGGTGTNRNLSITPALNESGTATITVVVADGSGGTVVDTFSLTVTAVNQPPTLNPLTNLTISEDAGPQIVNIGGISSGAVSESQTLTITASSSDTGLISNPAVSYTSPNSSGSILFTPLANGNGTTTLSVNVSDGQSQFGRSFTVTILPSNDPPTISDIPNQSILQNSPTATIPFAIADPETAPGNLTLNAASSNPALIPLAGIVLGGSGANRTIRMTPSVNQFGFSTITVSVSDGNGGLSSDAFEVAVAAGNLPPTLDPLGNISIPEDAGVQTVSLSGIGAGATGEAQLLVIAAVSSNPGLIPNPNVSYISPGNTSSLSLQAATNAHGTAVITVTVSDGQTQNATISRTFEVAVNPVNDAPTLNPIANLSLVMNTVQHSVPLSGISAGAANENQLLSLTATSSDPTIVPNPTVNYFSPNSTGSLLLNPAPDISGTATITISVQDGQSEHGVLLRTFTVTLRGSNTPPTISDIADLSVPMNGSGMSVPFIIGDVETSATSLQMLANSSNPSLVSTNNINFSNTGSNRLATIVPASGQSGVAVITLTVIDLDGASAAESFVLNVVAPNSPPTLDALANIVLTEDAGSRIINLTGISDGSVSEDQALTFSVASSNPALVLHPTLNYISPSSTGTLTFAPVANGNGSAVITVTVNDGQGQNNLLTRVFTITVNPINDAPAVTTIPNQQVDHDTASALLAFTINDVETPASSLGVSCNSSSPTLIPNANILLGGSGANRTIKVTPAAGQSGTALITLVVTDGVLSAGSSFLVTVGSTNTPPSLVAPSTLATDSYTALQNVSLKISDVESRAEDLVLTATSYNQTVLPGTNITLSGSGTNRTATFKPVAGKSGEVSISFAVTDGRALTRTLCQLTVEVGTPPKAKLNVRKRGNGTIQPALDGQDLTIGQSYTLKAIPASDEVFTGWSGSVTSVVPSVTFIMKSNLVLEAGFTNSPYLNKRGTYNGLFYEAAEVRQKSSGSFTLTETDRGTFTGKLRSGMRSFSFSGSLDLDCKATNIIVRKGQESLRVEFDFSGGASNQVVGRVTDGVWESPLSGDRSVFSKANRPSPYAGTYTLIVPGQENSEGPHGDGVGSLKVDENGLATLTGTLADGTKVAQRVSVAAAGQWPLYVPLYSGGGSVLSWLTLTNRPADDLTGLLSWIKPAHPQSKYFSEGFTNETFVTGSSYLSPAASGQPILNLTAANLVFMGSDLPSVISQPIHISENGRVVGLDDPKLKMTFSASSGFFAGSSVHPATGKAIKFNGAVHQKQNRGFGFMLGTNTSGRVFLSE